MSIPALLKHHGVHVPRFVTVAGRLVFDEVTLGELKDQLAQAVSGLADAQAAAQQAADALAAFQADDAAFQAARYGFDPLPGNKDAATDASQLAAQAQADADVVQAALDAVKNPPAEPPVLSEPVSE